MGTTSSAYAAYLSTCSPVNLNVPAEYRGAIDTSPDQANVSPSFVLTTTEYGLPVFGRVVKSVSVTLIGPNRR